MSTAEILSLISKIAYGIAAVSAFFAVFFWFRYKIPSVIGDLSGRTARKSIARLRMHNERAGGKGYRPSAANEERGKLTDTMQHSRKLKDDKKKTGAMTGQPEKKAEKKAPAQEVVETGVLAENKSEPLAVTETDLLDGTVYTELLAGDAVTESLEEQPKRIIRRSGGKALTMLDEVILIHTNEVIG